MFLCHSVGVCLLSGFFVVTILGGFFGVSVGLPANLFSRHSLSTRVLVYVPIFKCFCVDFNEIQRIHDALVFVGAIYTKILNSPRLTPCAVFSCIGVVISSTYPTFRQSGSHIVHYLNVCGTPACWNENLFTLPTEIQSHWRGTTEVWAHMHFPYFHHSPAHGDY